MKKLQMIGLLILITHGVMSQENKSKDLIYGECNYGFETNHGNTGFLFGVGYQRNLSQKIILQAEIQNFRTGIIDHNWQYIKNFKKEERYDHSSFFNCAIGYAIIGKTDRFNITLKGGLSLAYVKSKTGGPYIAIFYPNGANMPEYDPGYLLKERYIVTTSGVIYGLGVVIPETIKYHNDNKIALGYNLGLEANIPMRKGKVLTLGYSSVSPEIPLQYLCFPIPMISYKIKLK